jgi:hypothetical protein
MADLIQQSFKNMTWWAHPQAELPIPSLGQYKDYPASEEYLKSLDFDDEIRKLDVTRRGFFRAANFFGTIDKVVGALASLSSVAAVSVTAFGLLSKTLPETLGSALVPNVTFMRGCMTACFCTFPFMAISWYCDWKSESARQFRAGVHYNLLYRRLKAIKRAPVGPRQVEMFKDYANMRDLFEQTVSASTFDWLHNSVKSDPTAKPSTKPKDKSCL